MIHTTGRLPAFVTTSVIAAVVLLLAGRAPAVNIVDSLVEDTSVGGSWSGTSWTVGWPQYLLPQTQEGAGHYHVNHTQTAGHGQFGSLTLQQGRYTLEFGIGNYNNSGFPTYAIDFAGLTLSDAYFVSTPTPPSGGWVLWTAVFDVASGNPNLGNALDFSIAGSGSVAAGALDGVGSLSGNGTGFLVDLGAPPSGTVIINSPVEDVSVGGEWSGAIGSWTVGWPQFLMPQSQEGAGHFHVNNTQFASHGQFGSLTLQQGTYTLQFAMGNYNNSGFPTYDVDFAGLTLADASSASTPTPAAGDWELWTVTFDVTSGNPNLGNALDFTISGSGPVVAGAFDGTGTGFMVYYIPEPCTFALSAIGLLGLLGWGRRRKN